jgi:hypothetical protein
MIWLPAREETREVVKFASERLQPGDLVYHSNTSNETFWYYCRGSGQFDFTGGEVIQGAGRYLAPWDYAADIKRLKNRPRVWILLAHMKKSGDVDEEEFLLRTLDTAGTRLDEFKARNASAYLYDMRGQ